MKQLPLLFSLFAVAVSGCKKDDGKAAEGSSQEPSATPGDTPEAPATDPEAQPAEKDQPAARASAELSSASGSSVTGTVNFEEKDGKIMVTAQIEGLSPGDHGFHIHEKGDCSAPDASSAGGHFNPAGVEHGAPSDPPHHAGDLGNLTANEEGVAQTTMEVEFLSLEEGADNNIRGRAVVVHGKADDLESQPSGQAGPRVACGVIQ